MTSLPDCLKAASKGTRPLSDAVLLAMGWERSKYEKELFCPPLNHPARGKFKPGVLIWQPGPDPTRSLDDVVAMVPGGWGWSLGCNFDRGQMYSSIIRGPHDTTRPEGQSGVGFSNTPALALCIALLATKDQVIKESKDDYE